MHSQSEKDKEKRDTNGSEGQKETNKAGLPKKSGSSSSSSSKIIAVDASKDKRWHSFMVKEVKFTVDSKYKPYKVKGSGAYGCVCSAVDTVTKQAVAIKKVTDAFADLVDARRVLREVKLLRHFRHENIVSLLDMIEPNEGPLKDLYLVLELMDTDLSQVIRTKTKEISTAHIQYFLYQILRGLKYIHSIGVVHRDLKPANILVNANCDLKICDFGLAKGMSDSLPLTEYVVTRWYRAPEVMCAVDYDNQIDVWSVGCILGELLGKKPLFPGSDYISQMELIIKHCGTPSSDDMTCVTNEKAAEYIRGLPRAQQKRAADLFPDADPSCLDLMDKMLTFNPRKRITVDQALMHPYLSKLTDQDDIHSAVNKYRDPNFGVVRDYARHFCGFSEDMATVVAEYWQGIDLDYEKIPLTKQNLIKEFWEEIYQFRPHLRGRDQQGNAHNSHRNGTGSRQVSQTDDLEGGQSHPHPADQHDNQHLAGKAKVSNPPSAAVSPNELNNLSTGQSVSQSALIALWRRARGSQPPSAAPAAGTGPKSTANASSGGANSHSANGVGSTSTSAIASASASASISASGGGPALQPQPSGSGAFSSLFRRLSTKGTPRE